MKTIFTFFLLLNLNFLCYSQNNESKIKEINKGVVFYLNSTFLSKKEIDKRIKLTGDKRFNDIKEMFSKKQIENNVIGFFNKNFTSDEIDKIHKQLINSDYVISSELRKKRNLNYDKLLKIGYKYHDSVLNQIKKIDVLYFETNKEMKLDLSKKINIKRANGIYEVTSYQQSNDRKTYLKSLKLKIKPAMVFKDIDSISIEIGSRLQYGIGLYFLKNKSKFKKLTETNIGKPIVIVINNKIILAPKIDVSINDGKVIVFGNFEYKEAFDIMNLIKDNKK